MADEVNATEGQEESTKRGRKLMKAIEGTVVKITALGGEQGEMKFDTAKLPEKIQDNMVPFGTSHKLGDSAAGRSGKDAEQAILKVWDGLMAGDWSVRAPAQPKVSINEIQSNLNNLPEKDRIAAEALLKKLNIALPGGAAA